MADGISPHQRVQVLDRMNAMAWEFNQIGAWLGESGAETKSDMLVQAARSDLAPCWLLARRRPVRDPGWQMRV